MCFSIYANVANSSFNLNLLECKYVKAVMSLLDEVVLISTYWNVNVDATLCAFKLAMVLIST